MLILLWAYLRSKQDVIATADVFAADTNLRFDSLEYLATDFLNYRLCIEPVSVTKAERRSEHRKISDRSVSCSSHQAAAVSIGQIRKGTGFTPLWQLPLSMPPELFSTALAGLKIAEEAVVSPEVGLERVRESPG